MVGAVGGSGGGVGGVGGAGGGGVRGPHGVPVLELLGAPEEPALDGGAVEGRAGDVEDSSPVLAAAG